ncbi:MAG: LPS-assembly lipoprotein [Alphaproteobacteria bacterium]|jgi:LPS-assembly lipoprotein|nr:LPS-assembly lipoprotein [Alphaproteobacteria bacterium]
MGWGEARANFRRWARVPTVLVAGALTAGCFQPLYGGGTSPDQPTVRSALRSVDVLEIAAPANSSEARIAVQMRNDLMFGFTAGADPQPPTHRLKVQITGGRSVVTIDRQSALPNVEAYGLSSTYSLTEIGTGKVVVTGRASTNVSYDTLGQQRFARISGMHDAERRAAKVISDNITTRLASYFISGS